MGVGPFLAFRAGPLSPSKSKWGCTAMVTTSVLTCSLGQQRWGDLVQAGALREARCGASHQRSNAEMHKIDPQAHPTVNINTP